METRWRICTYSLYFHWRRYIRYIEIPKTDLIKNFLGTFRFYNAPLANACWDLLGRGPNIM